MIWDDAARSRLVATRRALGHAQGDLVEELQKFGAPATTQPTISAWETGRTRRPPEEFIAAIATYCQQVPEHGRPGGGPASGSTGQDDFDDVMRGVTEEPLLGEHQRALVEAMTERLRHGPPLSSEDAEAARWLRATLRVGSDDG